MSLQLHIRVSVRNGIQNQSCAGAKINRFKNQISILSHYVWILRKKNYICVGVTATLLNGNLISIFEQPKLNLKDKKLFIHICGNFIVYKNNIRYAVLF